MVWLTLEVFVGYLLFASVALVASFEIVVFASCANPSSIREWILFVSLLGGIVTVILLKRSITNTTVPGLLIFQSKRKVADLIITKSLIHGSLE